MVPDWKIIKFHIVFHENLPCKPPTNTHELTLHFHFRADSDADLHDNSSRSHRVLICSLSVWSKTTHLRMLDRVVWQRHIPSEAKTGNPFFGIIILERFVLNQLISVPGLYQGSLGLQEETWFISRSSILHDYSHVESPTLKPEVRKSRRDQQPPTVQKLWPGTPWRQPSARARCSICD